MELLDILKNKETGTQLFDKVHDDVVYLTYVDKENIHCENGYSYVYETDGCICDYRRRIPALVPSSSMQEWEKFAWQKGDILVSTNNGKTAYIIFESFTDDFYNTFNGKYLYKDDIWFDSTVRCHTLHYRKVTKEQSNTFIKMIEEHYGGTFNKKSITIEKKEITLKPFDKVLVRNNSYSIWDLDFFKYQDKNKIYHCLTGDWKHCILYKGNEDKCNKV